MSDTKLGIFDGGAEQEEGDVPSADPQIKVDYEAALGRFLVAFNKLDYELGMLIKMILLYHHQRDGLIQRSAFEAEYFWKVHNLELLSLPGGRHQLEAKLPSLLRDIGAFRNKIAHGHFDQNPFDGSFVQRGKKPAKPHAFTTGDLDAYTKKCEQAWNDVRHAEAAYWFDAMPTQSKGK